MKNSLFLLTVACAQGALSNVLQRAAAANVCNANNCLRGVRGTDPAIKPALASRSADCSAYLRATFTPTPITTTVTIATSTVTETPGQTITLRGLEDRQAVTPGGMPAYATYCPSPSAYSSACSCMGITKATTTLPASTVTAFATATATVTYVPPPPSVTCAAGLTACGTDCKSLVNDNNNCGTCGNVCSSGLVCGQGACIPPSSYACTPGAPGTFPTCGGSCGGHCFPDVNGAGYCKISATCSGLQACTTGAECPSTVCLVNACGHVCADTTKLCPTNNLPRDIFRKKDVVERDLVQSEIGLVDSKLVGSV